MCHLVDCHDVDVEVAGRVRGPGEHDPGLPRRQLRGHRDKLVSLSAGPVITAFNVHGEHAVNEAWRGDGHFVLKTGHNDIRSFVALLEIFYWKKYQVSFINDVILEQSLVGKSVLPT